MSTTAAISPLPWEVIQATEHHGTYIVCGSGVDVCDLYFMSKPLFASTANGGPSKPVPFVDAEANAEFIVTAVNSHDALTARIAEQEKRIAELEKALETDGWQPMDTAPDNGKHCILSVPEPGGFIYSVQGMYHDGKWYAVHRDDVKPIAWRPNKLLPDAYMPARAALTEGEGA